MKGLNTLHVWELIWIGAVMKKARATKMMQMGGVEFKLPPNGLCGSGGHKDPVELDEASGDAEDSHLFPNQLEGKC